MRGHKRRLEAVEDKLRPPQEYVPIRWNDPATGEVLPGAEEAIAKAKAEGKTPIVVVRSIVGQPDRHPDYPADFTIRIRRPHPRDATDTDDDQDGGDDWRRGPDEPKPKPPGPAEAERELVEV